MKKSKKGFTLAELLVVIAIIAVLAGISIPVFTNQTKKANQAVDNANVRAKYAEVAAEASMNNEDKNGTVAAIEDYDGKTSIAGATEISWSKNQIITIKVTSTGSVTITGADSTN